MLDFELREVEWDERLGFGIEFEFALATLPLGTEDPQPEEGRQIYSIDVPLDSPTTDPNTLSDIDRELNVQLHIVNTLKTKVCPVASQIQRERDYKAWKNGDLDTEPGPSDISWIVKHDDTIQFPSTQVNPYKWYKVKICTPALMFSPWNVRHIWSGIGALTRNYRLNCNPSCGLHIHVSTAKKEFTLDILKNLMGLIFTFERQLEKCHPSYRIHNNPSTYSLRDHANINQNYEPGKNFSCSDPNWKSKLQATRPLTKIPARSPRFSLAAIFNAQSKNELVQMFSTDEDIRLGYNIESLAEPPPHPFKHAIEFRQHASTTEPADVERWLNICCRLVEVARQTAGAPPEEKHRLRDFLDAHVEDEVEDFGLLLLLVCLGLPREADFFHRHRVVRLPERKSLVEMSGF
ncbi:hypothetical protein NHQ30_008926 [Ciborinia camelliae]|nr:hypothetical protein NHQ30_008926 [Ciborinia camelliae]